MRRRTFLGATALGATGLGTTALSAAAAEAPSRQGDSGRGSRKPDSAAMGPSASGREARFDFVIVGAGTAGLPAAIFASRRGARVLLLDAAADVGGTLHLANGQVSAANTRTQAAKGIVDSPDTHFAEVIRLSNGLSDRNVARITADEAPDTINWLLDNGLTPLPDHPVTGDSPGRKAYEVPRYIWGQEEGRAILAVIRRELAPEIASGRVTVQLNARVSSLILEDGAASGGAVIGVRARVGDREQSFFGRHILLTTGGYAMNPQKFEQLVGFPCYAGTSYPWQLGDGLDLALSAGGYLRGRELHRAGTGSVLTSERFPSRVYVRFNTTPQARPPWEIWVDDTGRRFVREDEPLVFQRESALLRQPALRYRILFDQAIVDAAPVGVPKWSREQLLAHFDSHAMFARADSLESLAQRLGMDPGTLVATVREYNEAVKRRGGDAFGREHLPLPIAKPPFYAITHLGHSATSSAGIVVDAQMRVLRGSGQPVPNLYAAGEVLGSGALLGNSFVPGMMLTPSLVLGRKLGRELPIG